MNQKDLNVSSIATEIYPMLLELCGNAGIDIADLVKELAAKQQLQDIRRGLVLVTSGSRVQ
jgi:hypothetical protein